MKKEEMKSLTNDMDLKRNRKTEFDGKSAENLMFISEELNATIMGFFIDRDVPIEIGFPLTKLFVDEVSSIIPHLDEHYSNVFKATENELSNGEILQ